jgi:tetraacyldisaccharide 4'-kinase
MPVLRAIVRTTLLPLSALYAIASRVDARLRQRRAFTSRLPVISVGNIGVGGSGKTPLVELLVRELQPEPPVLVLSRGYGRSDNTERVWRAGEPAPDPDLVGDEPALLARSIVRGGLAVGPDRARLLARIEGEFSHAVVLLDDGFQHRQLDRTLDIVVLDDATATGPALLIPAGRLRERPAALGRADLVVAMSQAARSLAERYVPAERVFDATTVARDIVRVADGAVMAPSGPLILVTGIARPERVRATLETRGVGIARHMRYADHRRYGSEDVRAILRALDEESAAGIVTTEKDAVKLEHFSELRSHLAIVRVGLRIAGEERFLRFVRQAIDRARVEPPGDA